MNESTVTVGAHIFADALVRIHGAVCAHAVVKMIVNRML